eukprot:CAMPEP_0201582928 /NCGR_PEP_ID=MMETSP0190_2-20130828/92297_1 /ASSEMBLY_ACC=CAM_ASM_000263 /TAXON_ID=37353 /ORGANISM="Rosalina sp." /LENGTH=357 /DNA_ID=CAMNT_0048023875 /DNA_START=21 /DNA_END=1094 /DNA_ORIENTATION=-
MYVIIFVFSMLLNSVYTEDNSQYPLLRLPRINVQKYIDGSIKEREEVTASLKRYIHEYGTFSIFNHGISFDLIDEIKSLGSNFFCQSDAFKSKYSSNGLGTPGYEPLKSLSASAAYGDKDNDGDYTEMFAFFNHIADGNNNDYKTYHPLPDKDSFYNYWYNTTMQYIEGVTNLLEILHNMTSDALGLEQNYFNDLYSTSPHLQLRYLNYPKMNNSHELAENNKYRISAHKDYLGYSLMHPGNVRGLQNKIGGIWMDIVTNGPVAYDIFVNVGELFDIWTNGYWKANMHRVIMNEHERMTFTLFTGPDNDLMIEPIKGCDVCTNNKQMYMSRTTGQHAQLRFSGSDLKNPDGLKFFSD